MTSSSEGVVCGASPNIHPGGIGSGGIVHALSPYERAMVQDSISFDPFNNELKWQYSKEIFERITSDTSLLDSTYVNHFYTDTNYKVLAQLLQIQTKIQTAMLPDSASSVQLNTWQTNVDSIMAIVWGYDSVRATLVDTNRIVTDSIETDSIAAWIYNDEKSSISPLTDTALLNFIAAVDLSVDSVVIDTSALDSVNNLIAIADSSIGLIAQSADSLEHILDSLRYLRMAVILDSNIAISSSVDIEQDYQNLFNVYLNTLALDADTLYDSSQLATLYYLAFECPLKGGQATFWARGMLALFIDTSYNDDSLCSSDRMDMSAKRPNNTSGVNSLNSTQNITGLLFPNPAKGHTVLQLNQPVNNPLELKITDNLGQVVMDKKVSFATSIYNINTSSYSSGIYSVNLFDDSDKLFSGKLCIFSK